MTFKGVKNWGLNLQSGFSTERYPKNAENENLTLFFIFTLMASLIKSLRDNFVKHSLFSAKSFWGFMRKEMDKPLRFGYYGKI